MGTSTQLQPARGRADDRKHTEGAHRSGVSGKQIRVLLLGDGGVVLVDLLVLLLDVVVDEVFHDWWAVKDGKMGLQFNVTCIENRYSCGLPVWTHYSFSQLSSSGHRESATQAVHSTGRPVVKVLLTVSLV